MTFRGPIRLLIADDHSVVRAGLRALLHTPPEIAVAGEAATADAAVRMYGEIRPDVALIDARMPAKTGIEATREIRAAHPTSRVLILSSYDGDNDVAQALEAGAIGYVLKAAPGEELVQAIRFAMEGKRWISPELNSRLAERMAMQQITDREVEVLKLIATGASNKEIGSALYVTEHTAKAHVKHIIAKLGAPDRTGAVMIALTRGIIHLPER